MKLLPAKQSALLRLWAVVWLVGVALELAAMPAEHRYLCHSTKAKRLKAELYLDNRAAAYKSGERGVVIKPGHVDCSLLIRVVRDQEESWEMPPKAKPPAAAFADSEKWVAMGAPWPDTGNAVIAAGNKGFDFVIFRRDTGRSSRGCRWVPMLSGRNDYWIASSCPS